MRAALYFVLASVACGAAPDRLEVSENGRKTGYVVATDEVGRIQRDGTARVEKISQQKNGVQTTEFLKSHRPVAGEKRRDLILYQANRPHTTATRRWLTTKVIAQLAPDANPGAIADGAGAVGYVTLPFKPDTAVFIAKDVPGEAFTLAATLRNNPAVLSAEPMLARQSVTRLTPNDSYFTYNAGNAAYQWYLKNTGQNGGTTGIDINISSVWDTWRGAGVRIGIVDEGVQLTHPDLAANVDTANDYDWNSGDSDASAPQYETHGTYVTGLVAARGSNALGISGAAPESTLVPLRLLAGPVTDLEEASAFSWKNDIIQIKTNSWGPTDDGQTLGGPGLLAEAAIEDGVRNGRGGLGTIYIWSAGDGGANDNSNFDGYANSIYAIGIGSVTDQGSTTSYSEKGANILVCTPSSSTGRQGVLTTDKSGPDGANNGTLAGDMTSGDYTNTFGGTSASAPLAAGVVALMLQSKPTLGWRDVKEILLRSAVKNSPADADWVNNGAGFHFNHKFGAGLLDTQAAVNMAATWTNLDPMTSVRKALTSIATAIPDAPAAGVSRTFTIAAGENLRVESIALDAGFSHASRGQIEITLTSPSGTVSQLSTQRPLDTASGLFWRYTSVRHWGESATGTWTVTVTDKAAGTTGTLNTLILYLYGSNSAATAAPVVNSALTASTNAGSDFSYQILALNSPTSFTATGLPAGLTVNTLTGLVSGKATTAGTYNVTIGGTNSIGTGTKTLVLTAGASLGAPLGDAVEQSGLTWTTVGNANWNSQVTTTHDGVDAAKAGVISDNGQTTMRTYATGPAVLRFWWKVSSELDSDILAISDNGTELAFISGEVDWTQALFYLPAGIHRLEWVYSKDSATASGSDTAWVDQVELLNTSKSPPLFTIEPSDITVPVGGILPLCTEIVGQQPITYQWYKAPTSAQAGVVIAGATSACYAVNPVVAGSAGYYTCTATNALGTATTSGTTVAVSAAQASLATATDNSLVWCSFGNVPWASQNATTHDGVDAAKAGTIANSGSTSMLTTVFGPGTLTFWWKVSSQQGFDILDFLVDGNPTDYITGTAGWMQASWPLSAGAHTLEWVYSKDATTATGSDTGWVDQVVFTQKPYATWAASAFTLAQRVSATFTDPLADPNGDGVSNLLAYATGISPTAGIGTPLPFIASSGVDYTFTYQRNTTATDVTYAIQRTQDFASWTTVTTTDTVVSTVGNIQTIRATLPTVAGVPWFYRLQVTLSP